MKISTLTILKTLANNYPDTTVFRKNIIENTARDLGFTGKDFVPLLTKEARVKIGTYDLTSVMPKPEETPKASASGSATIPAVIPPKASPLKFLKKSFIIGLVF